MERKGSLSRDPSEQLIPGVQGARLRGQAGTACECKQYLSAARMKGQLSRRAQCPAEPVSSLMEQLLKPDASLHNDREEVQLLPMGTLAPKETL